MREDKIVNGWLRSKAWEQHLSFLPVKRMTREKKNTLQLILATCLVVFGCTLIAMAFCIPPTGEIHPSVLAAFGEILTFAGAVIGVDYRYKYKSERDERNIN